MSNPLLAPRNHLETYLEAHVAGNPHQLPRHWICATQDSTACGVFSTHSACAEVVRGESPGLGVPRGLPGLL